MNNVMAAGRAGLICDQKYARSRSFSTDLERDTITAWHFESTAK